MSTWRNWLRTLMPWTAGERRGSSQSSESGSTPSYDTSTESTIPFLPAEIGVVPDRLYPLLPLKQWAASHISPYAWDRAVIRSLPALQQTGVALPLVLAPRVDTQIPGKVIQTITNALSEMYGVQPPLHEIFQKESV